MYLDFCLDEDIINYEVLRKAQDRSKAKKRGHHWVYDNMTNEVQGNNQLYNTFVEYLRKEYSRYRVTVARHA